MCWLCFAFAFAVPPQAAPEREFLDGLKQMAPAVREQAAAMREHAAALRELRAAVEAAEPKIKRALEETKAAYDAGQTAGEVKGAAYTAATAVTIAFLAWLLERRRRP